MTEQDDGAYTRPDGVDAGFAPRPDEPVYSPPPPTISPEERAIFHRPPGGAEFAPLPGERIEPRTLPPAPVPPVLTESFGPPPKASGSFDPAPGTRIFAKGAAPESPWWKPDAARDPWRDPAAAFWLGRGAVFPGGRPEQLSPDADEEQDEPVPVPPDDDAEQPAVVASLTARRLSRRLVLMLLAIGVVVGGAGGGVGYWLASNADSLHSDVSLPKSAKPANRPPGSVADIAQRVGPAVVSISVTTANEYAVGSGVVIDKSGYVLTNDHVVASASNGQGTIVVTFASEATAKARIVGLDPASDLAVLKVPTQELTVASLGDSDKLAVGDPVIAIGSPLALQGTVTSGIVSALNRAVHIPDSNGGPGVYLDAIQTDAAINHGNSGGALVDASGSVVGINSAAEFGGSSSTVTGIGFAIPINYARGIAQQLIRTGKAVHATLGTQGKSVTTTDGLHNGAYLEQVDAGGPADKAGLKAGDVIVAAGGVATPSYEDLAVIVQNHKPGDRLDLVYFRGSARHTASVTLGSD